MPTAMVAVAIVGVIVAICLLLIRVNKNQKRKAMNKLFQQFSELGSIHNLNFSSHEIIGKYIVGFDGVRRKFAVLRQVNDVMYQSQVINLNDVKSCTVQKQYGTIPAGNGSNIDSFLEKITLHFEMKNNKEAMNIVFFDHAENSVYSIKENEEKAKHWETMLSKMLHRPMKKIA